MRSYKEIKSEFLEVDKNKEMVEYRPNCWGYAKMERVSQLREEADALLSDAQRLAIVVHDSLCKINHTDGCSWSYEINGIDRDWEGRTHKRYLQKAEELLEISSNAEALINLFKCVKYI